MTKRSGGFAIQLWVLLYLALPNTSRVHAQSQSQDASPYLLDLRIALPLIALSGAVGLGGFLKRAELPECAPSMLPVTE